MTEKFYHELKKEIERVLNGFTFEEKTKTYQRLYFSSLGEYKTKNKSLASAHNGINFGGRPRLPLEKLKNPKAAVWRRKRRAELKNK